MESQDDLLPSDSLAIHIAAVIDEAHTRDCPNQEAVTTIEKALDNAYKVWTEHDNPASSAYWGKVG
jgi:hypothetical protein